MYGHGYPVGLSSIMCWPEPDAELSEHTVHILPSRPVSFVFTQHDALSDFGFCESCATGHAYSACFASSFPARCAEFGTW